jgi:CHAD domain-containing protein
MPKHNRILWNVSQTAAENAAGKLPKLAREYFRTGRAIFEKKSAARSLHPFRLETKRFRYTLELFSPCYGPGLEERLAMLRKIQDYLGDINDCMVTEELLGKTHKRVSAFLARRKAARMRAMRDYWRNRFDAAGQERRWTNYLSRFARN